MQPPLSIDRQIELALTAASFVVAPAGSRVQITGADGLDLLHRLSTNHLLGGLPGGPLETVFCNEKGKVLDVAEIGDIGDGILMLLKSPSPEEIMRWLTKFTITESVTYTDLSPFTNETCILGPQAESITCTIFDRKEGDQGAITPMPERGVLAAWHGWFANLPCVRIITRRAGTLALVHRLRLVESDGRLGELNPDAYETLRIHLGVPGWGTEIRDAFNPFEIGLKHLIAFTKGCYIGQEVISRLDAYGKVQRQLLRLSWQPRGDVKLGDFIFKQEKQVGVLTSISPSLFNEKMWGLAVLRTDALAGPGEFQFGQSGISLQVIFHELLSSR